MTFFQSMEIQIFTIVISIKVSDCCSRFLLLKEASNVNAGWFRYQMVERLRRRMSLVSSPIFSSHRHPFLLLLPFPSRQLSSPITIALKQATVVSDELFYCSNIGHSSNPLQKIAEYLGKKPSLLFVLRLSLRLYKFH